MDSAKIDPGYEILSARYANDEGSAIELQTIGFGAVMVSTDRAELWAHAQEWIGKGNSAAAYAAPVVEPVRDAIAELDALKGALLAKSVVSESDLIVRLSDENAQELGIG